jgi:hypothetical protein
LPLLVLKYFLSPALPSAVLFSFSFIYPIPPSGV